MGVGIKAFVCHLYINILYRASLRRESGCGEDKRGARVEMGRGKEGSEQRRARVAQASHQVPFHRDNTVAVEGSALNVIT